MRTLRRLTLSGWLMIGLAMSPVRAQVAAPTSVEGQIASISADITALETIQRSIEIDNHRLIITKHEVDGRMVTGAVLNDPEQVESWFVTAISRGMTGAQAVDRARNIGQLTRFYLNDIVAPVLGALLGSARKVQALGTPDSLQVKAALEKVEAEIRDLEDIQRKIEQERHVFLLVPGGGGVLITRQQAGTIYGSAVFMGSMNPDSLQGAIDKLLGITRIYLNTYILPDLASSRSARQKLLIDLATLRNPDQPPMVEDDPMHIRRAGGTWSVKCLISDVESTDGGSFLLEIIPSGAISGTYEASGGRFAVTGYRFGDGSARGGGSNASGTFEWSGSLSGLGTAPFYGGGPVSFTASSGGTCTGSWKTS